MGLIERLEQAAKECNGVVWEDGYDQLAADYRELFDAAAQRIKVLLKIQTQYRQAHEYRDNP